MFILDQKARRTLRIVAMLWLTFGIVLFGGGYYLGQLAAAVQAEKFPKLAQPRVSESEDAVAYLAQPPDSAIWHLWRATLPGGQAQEICQLDPGEWTLLGWFDEDKRLLLQPRAQDVPRVVMVEVATGKQKEIRFESDGIRLVGVRGGQLFFERYGKGEGADELTDSLTLLEWTPGDEQLTEVVTVPFESEKLRISRVWPSLNHKMLALSITMGEEEQERALWFYDREADRLSWSGVRVPCRAIRGTWSADSAGFVAAVETETECTLYQFKDVSSGQYSKLNSGDETHAYQPFWPRAADYFLLVEKQAVYRFDPDELRATQLTAPGWEIQKSRDFSVSSLGNYGVYIGPEGDDDQLYYVSFQADSCHNLLPEHDKLALRQRWWYVLGDSFNTFFRTWTLHE